MSVQQHDTIWIFSAGMRRSASTLQYHLARELIEYVGGHAAGWVTWQKFDQTYKELDGNFPFVILKCHAFIPAFSSVADILIKKNKAKALTIFRDPRDVAASMVRMEHGNYPDKTWDAILDDVSVVLKEYTAWSSLNGQCLTQQYGKSNKFLLRELASFLDILYLSKFEQECINRHTLDAHRELIKNSKEKRFDYKTLLWHNHIDSGKIGQYKQGLTKQQLVEVEAVIEDWKRKL